MENRNLFAQSLSFWPDHQAVVLSSRIVLLRGDANPLGRFPGQLPSFDAVLGELHQNRACWASLRVSPNEPMSEPASGVDFLVGRFLVHAVVGKNASGDSRLWLRKKGAIEFASNQMRIRTLASGRMVKHEGIACITGPEFNQFERHGSADGSARFWSLGQYVDTIMAPLKVAATERPPPVATLSSDESQVLGALEELVNVEHQVEEDKARAIPPLLYTEVRAEPRQHVHRQFYRLTLAPESAKRMANDKPRLTVEKGEGEGFPLQVEEVLPACEVIASVGRQVDASRFPPSGRLLFDAGTTSRNVRLKVLERLGEGSHPWLTKVAANVYDAPALRAQPITDGPPNLNPSQARAIGMGLESPDYVLVLGPPGTGKTTVILEWVKRFVAEGKRVLIATQNNKAVDNVLERLAKSPTIECVRLGSESKVMATVQPMLLEVKARDIQSKLVQRGHDAIADLRMLRDWIESLQAVLPTVLGRMNEVVVARAALQRAEDARFAAEQRRADGEAARERALADWEDAREGRAALAVRIGADRHWAVRALQLLLRPVSVFRWWKLGRSEQRLRQEVAEQVMRQREDASNLAQRNEESSREAERLRTALHERDQAIPTQPAWAELLGFGLEQLPAALPQAHEALGREGVRIAYLEATVTAFLEAMQDEGQAGLLPLLLSLVDVVGATCIGIESKPQFREVPFDVVIIDESGQIQLHNLMVPLSRAPKAILVGDHKQLPPVVDAAITSELKERGVEDTELLDKSWFEKLWGDAPADRRVMLDTQFRCPAVISDYISAEFYESAYYAGRGMTDKKPLLALARSCLLVIDTSDHPRRGEVAQKREDRNEVMDNPLETELVGSVLMRAVAERPELADDPEGIGVIVPYKNHVERIRKHVQELVRKQRLPKSFQRSNDMIASVDSFQGQERHLIIFTLTRANRQGSVGFLADARRLNVAMTRAKQQLVMIGDLHTLGYVRGDADPEARDADFKQKIRALADYAQTRGHLMSAAEWQSYDG